MKKLTFFLIPLLLLIVAVSCSEEATVLENTTSTETSGLYQDLSAGQIAAQEHIMKKSKELGIEYDFSLTKTGPESVTALLTYEAELCGDPTPGVVNIGSLSFSALWKYYRFSGNAGKNREQVKEVTIKL